MAKSKNEVLEKKQTKSDKIWDMIKNAPIDIFGLPNQEVCMHVERKEILDNVLHIRLKSTAVLPSLETVLNSIKLQSGEFFEIYPSGPYMVIEIKTGR